MIDIRLGFTGASGTGKTTLATYVAEKYGVPLNPVGSRVVARAMGYAAPYEVDAAGRRGEFQRKLVLEKRAWEDAHASFVTDRTTLDELVYILMHDSKAITEALLDSVFAGLKRYTLVVYCPTDVFCDVADDPMRAKSAVYQRLFDDVLAGLLYRYETPIVRIDVADLPARRRKIDAIFTCAGGQ